MNTSAATNARASAVPLFRLTDEDLHLLGAADDVDTPFLDRLKPDQRALAADIAYRSLLAHGVCEAQEGGLLVRTELVQLLQVRAGPERSYRMEVRSPGARSIRHLFEAGGTTVCEDISAEGVHDFDVRPVGDSRALLTEVFSLSTRPCGVARGVARRATWRAIGDHDLRGEAPPWGTVCATAELTARYAGGPAELVSVIWGDAGTFLMSELPVLACREGAAWTPVGVLADLLGIDRAS